MYQHPLKLRGLIERVNFKQTPKPPTIKEVGIVAKLSMKEVREIREFVIKGFPIKDVAEIFKVSETTIRNYTKAIRKKVG